MISASAGTAMPVAEAEVHGNAVPWLGFGLGLRKDYYDEILATAPPVDWFEVITENYLVPGGKPLDYLFRIRERFPMVMHGVSLSIGGTQPLNRDYLLAVKQLASRLRPAWISDHLCWTADAHSNLHDLLPLPYTDAVVRHVAQRVREVQDYLGRRILLENVSSYLTYKASDLTEWEFLSAIAAEADCLILLDVNNIFVSAYNHEFDPMDYLRGIPPGRVAQIHLAGHRDLGDYRIDTHDEPVIGPVWDLYAAALHRFGPVSTMIERDDKMPAFADLLAELAQARQIADAITPKRNVSLC